MKERSEPNERTNYYHPKTVQWQTEGISYDFSKRFAVFLTFY